MPQAVDHLIIGSGINGLVAAAMLAKVGRRVLVIEREERIGGCLCTSEDVTLPGFHHDIMATTWVLFMTGPAQAALGDDLAAHGMTYCHAAHPTAVLRPDGSALVLKMDRDANVAEFNARAVGDGDRHAADVGAIERDADFLFAILGGSLWTRQMAWMVAKRAWKMGLGPLKAWFGQALQPARGWLEANYEGADVQALWAPWVLHAGLTPESTYSGQMGRVIAFAMEVAGAPIVQGGSSQAAKAFESLITSKGGEIRTGVEAKRVIVEGGRCVGVETAEGEVIRAKSVIAGTAPGKLYGEMIQEGRAPEIAQPYRYGRGNFQLHFALEGPVEWASEDLEDVALIHLADGVDSVSKSANEAERGMLPVTPTICLGQPNRLDPSRCPEGKAILWLQIPDAPRSIKGDAAGEIETPTAEWTEEVREAFADRIEQVLSRHIKNWPGIRLKRRAYSPADLARMNVNLVGGDPYGGSCTLDQFFVWRPHAGQTNYGTGVKNFYHIGATTHPGPGLGGGSGFNVAKELGA